MSRSDLGPGGRGRSPSPPVPLGAYVAVSLLGFGLVLDDYRGYVFGGMLVLATTAALRAQRLNPTPPETKEPLREAWRRTVLAHGFGVVLVLLGLRSGDPLGLWIGAVVVGFTSLSAWYRRHAAGPPRQETFRGRGR